MNGYYICYEDTDSRVMPWYTQMGGMAPFKTELQATEHLLLYFQEMKADLNRCVLDTKTSLEKLRGN